VRRKMKLRTSIAAVGAAAIVGSGAFVVPALASQQATPTHTLTFISVTKTQISFSRCSPGSTPRSARPIRCHRGNPKWSR
jgi:hypothetical protein